MAPPATPPIFHYTLKGVFQLPRRLIDPPKAGVGTVRSFKITPLYDVVLSEVLDGKYLPPLCLKDFEEYLVFVEHSAENLYFHCWLRDYLKKYEDWQASIRHLPESERPTSNPALVINWARARGTFLDRGATLELNLPHEVLEEVYRAKGPHPAPSTLAPLYKQVEEMLHESLMRFVTTACGNSGRARGFFGIFVGICVIAIGLIPVLLSILDHRSRWVRLTALPAFWFGATTLVAALHGVCVVIFLFGDCRQLYPYELARPSLSPPQPLPPLPLPVTTKNAPPIPPPSLSTTMNRDDSSQTKQGSIFEDHKISISSPYPEDSPSFPSHPKDNTAASFLSETAGFITPFSPSEYEDHKRSSPPLLFDFDSLPVPVRNPNSPRASSAPSSKLARRGIMCQLTKVLDPAVTRAQWTIIMRSAVLGVLIALVMGGICFAVPFDE
ncbi:hypothetical protein FRC02_003954 [Tulasnella sp. 418]|nr:hypothetical protein FRC02_003954 [Tulasnella sp. 418]